MCEQVCDRQTDESSYQVDRDELWIGKHSYRRGINRGVALQELDGAYFFFHRALDQGSWRLVEDQMQK